VSATVAPKLTIFGGSLLNLSFGGGGGRRGRGKGGLLKRLTGFILAGYREVVGSTKSGPSRAGGGRTGGGDAAGFDRFRGSRPDLFEGQLGDDDGDQGDDREDIDMTQDSAPTSGYDAAGLARAIRGRDVDACDDSREVAGRRRPGYVPTGGDDARDGGWQASCPDCGHSPAKVGGTHHYDGCASGWGPLA